ncbi:MAG TPA: type II toxin-antitoxin system VapC family toxin [Chloroflexota bacterium]|nr:type II toxin-antitoxin system VapC family toxin [Chloroflexota bacterium]
MKYLVDTDWVVDYLRGREPRVSILNSLAEDGLAISLVTFGEIYEGIYSGHDPKGQEQGFLRFLRGVRVLSLNRATMQRFARTRGSLRRQGQMIGDPDVLIASTALHFGLTLITGNKRHFDRIPDLIQFDATAARR